MRGELPEQRVRYFLRHDRAGEWFEVPAATFDAVAVDMDAALRPGEILDHRQVGWGSGNWSGFASADSVPDGFEREVN